MFQKIRLNSFSIACIIFFIASFLFIGTCIYLSFFNHPNTDDYILGYNIKNLGFLEYQEYIYKHWGGRFFTNILGALFAHNQFLFQHYYLHTILLIIFFFISSYFFLESINRCWLHQFFSFYIIVSITIFADITLISCLPQLSTALFWFSSSITYLTSLILLLCFFGILIRLLRLQLPHRQIPFWFLLWINIAMLCGTNEIAALITGFILLIFAILTKKTIRFFNLMMLITAFVYLSFFLFSTLAPGNSERLALFGEKSIIAFFGGSFIRTVYTFFNIFQSPLFYLSAIIIFLLGVQYGGNTFVKKRGKNVLTNLVLCFTIIGISLFILHLPLMYHSNGSLPERATNLYVMVTAITIFMAVFYSGTQLENQAIVLITVQPVTYTFFLVAMSVSIFCNSTSREIIKSIISAKLYDRVLKERTNILSNSKLKQVSLPNYDSATTFYYNKMYGNNQKEFLKQLILQKPTALFFDDDLSSEKNIQEIKKYYQLDSIVVIQNKCN